MSLTDAQVTAIRTAGLTDPEWERRLRVPAKSIRLARVGATHQHVPTPPDTIPRRGTGVRKVGRIQIANRRPRGPYYRDDY